MRIARTSDASLQPMGTETFSGTVHRRELGPIEALDGLALAVSFEAGARTHWHRHSGGQVLYVVDGGGRVGTRDGTVAEIAVGDLVEVPPDEEHWHGAGAQASMTHLSLSFGEATWLEPVREG